MHNLFGEHKKVSSFQSVSPHSIEQFPALLKVCAPEILNL